MAFMNDLTWAYYIFIKSRCIPAFPPQGCLPACVVFFLDQRDIQTALQPGCHGNRCHMISSETNFGWERIGSLEGVSPPSQFIWHGCLGNKAVRQEAEKRCKLLFVWITVKKLPGLQTSRGYTIRLKIFWWSIFLLLLILKARAIHQPLHAFVMPDMGNFNMA